MNYEEEILRKLTALGKDAMLQAKITALLHKKKDVTIAILEASGVMPRITMIIPVVSIDEVE